MKRFGTGTIRFATGRQCDNRELRKLWNHAGVGVGDIAGRYQVSGVRFQGSGSYKLISLVVQWKVKSELSELRR